jgi:hypothetical protein
MPKKPTDGETPAEAELPVRQHLHDETKRPLKAPIGGVPPNIAEQFPGKGGKGHFGGQVQNKGRNFRHQGR